MEKDMQTIKLHGNERVEESCGGNGKRWFYFAILSRDPKNAAYWGSLVPTAT